LTVKAKILLFLLPIFLTSLSYAIQVNVKSPSRKVQALGFTVDGDKHGGLGKSYRGRNMPKGDYAFGIRSHLKDVPCLTKKGKKTVSLTKNTNATLIFNGETCVLVIKGKG